MARQRTSGFLKILINSFITFTHLLKTMANTELTLDQLKTCSGGWYLPAAYIIAKEGTKAICFYKDLAENLSEGKDVGAAVVAAGHSSGTIDD